MPDQFTPFFAGTNVF
jgi:hypothetical protein